MKERVVSGLRDEEGFVFLASNMEILGNIKMS